MSLFLVENISPSEVTILGITIQRRSPRGNAPGQRAANFADLMELGISPADIITSLKFGDLYHAIQGKMVTITNPTDFENLNATQADLNFFEYCGFMQGRKQEAELKYPFEFDGYNQLKVAAVVAADLPLNDLITLSEKTAPTLTAETVGPSMVAVSGVLIRALSTNGNIIYVGDDTVSIANGFPLNAGDAIFVSIDNVDKVYCIAPVANQKLRLIVQ